MRFGAHRRRALGAALTVAAAVNAAQAAPAPHEYVPPSALSPERVPLPPRAASPKAGSPVDQSRVAGGAPRRPGGALPPSARPDGFRIDPDTSEPNRVDYHDPFTPRVTPFKRDHVFDAVTATGELVVADPILRPVPSGAARAGDETFQIQISVKLGAGEYLELPTPGPDTRVVQAFSTTARGRFTLLEDGSGNWQLRADQALQGALTLQLAVPRTAFGGPFILANWNELGTVPATPSAVQSAARAVAQALGLSGQTPTQVVRGLVQHFRGFVPAQEPASGSGLELYRQLALGGRGVCRHRAYAFTVTALGLGIPARLAHNEAHAWVEVRLQSGWRRIDLGGAAAHVEHDVDDRPEHVPLRDEMPPPHPPPPPRQCRCSVRTRCCAFRRSAVWCSNARRVRPCGAG
jgi:transglutaminase-like putative cysteine protease